MKPAPRCLAGWLIAAAVLPASVARALAGGRDPHHDALLALRSSVAGVMLTGAINTLLIQVSRAVALGLGA